MTDEERKNNPWADDPDEQEAAVDTDGGGKSEIVYFKPQEGENIIRIVGRYKWFNEYWLGKVNRTVIAGPLKDCPIYNHPDKQKNLDKARALREAGKEEEAKALFRKTFATFDPRVRYVVNIIDRADGKVKIWKFSRSLKEEIMAISAKYGDPTKYDLILSRKGKKLETKYTIIPARENTELTESEKSLKTFNLDKIFKTTQLTTVQSYLRGEVPAKRSSKDQTVSTEVAEEQQVSSELTEEELQELGEAGDSF